MLLIIIVILCLACPFVSQKSILDHIWFWFLLKFNVLLFILKPLIILASVGGSNKDLTQLLARVPFLSSWQVTSVSVCSERLLGSVPPRVCLTLHSTEISLSDRGSQQDRLVTPIWRCFSRQSAVFRLLWPRHMWLLLAPLWLFLWSWISVCTCPLLEPNASLSSGLVPGTRRSSVAPLDTLGFSV